MTDKVRAALAEVAQFLSNHATLCVTPEEIAAVLLWTMNAPPLRGWWYEVKRADGSLCIRAYGDDLWWIPLPDGWLSGLPEGFKWRGPEMEDVAAIVGVTP
jgi:hypothetical protein